jgi:hypothetical protein
MWQVVKYDFESIVKRAGRRGREGVLMGIKEISLYGNSLLNWIFLAFWAQVGVWLSYQDS